MDELIEAQGLRQVTDSSAIESLVAEVLANNDKQVQQYLDGNQKVLGFLVGQVMKASAGKANPKQVNQLLRQRIEEQSQ